MLIIFHNLEVQHFSNNSVASVRHKQHCSCLFVVNFVNLSNFQRLKIPTNFQNPKEQHSEKYVRLTWWEEVVGRGTIISPCVSSLLSMWCAVSVCQSVSQGVLGQPVLSLLIQVNECQCLQSLINAMSKPADLKRLGSRLAPTTQLYYYPCCHLIGRRETHYAVCVY